MKCLQIFSKYLKLINKMYTNLIFDNYFTEKFESSKDITMYSLM